MASDTNVAKMRNIVIENSARGRIVSPAR